MSPNSSRRSMFPITFDSIIVTELYYSEDFNSMSMIISVTAAGSATF